MKDTTSNFIRDEMAGAFDEGRAILASGKEEVFIELMRPIHKILVLLNVAASYGLPVFLDNGFISATEEDIKKHIKENCETEELR